MILLLPGFYAHAIKQDGGGKGESRARMQLVALPIALLAAGSSWLIVPEDTGEWRSRFLINVVSDFQSLWKDPNAAWPAAPPNFSLAELGFQAQKDRLGGPAKLRSQLTLAVLTDSPRLLKGRVMDVYTGQNWETSLPDGDYRYESILWRSSRREAFDQDRPLGGRQARRLYNELTKEVSLEVSYEYSGSTSLFYAGRPRRLTFTDRLIDAQGFYNLRSELYMHLRMPSKQGYILKTRVWDTDKPDFAEQFLRLEALTAEARDTRYALLSPRYTALPETLPDSVRELAVEITQDSTSPYEKAQAIAAWLSANATYTLEPALPPENADFVEYFLETKEGYCTYYASALAVMARCVGIPSRYVTGFALKASGEDRYVATGRTAHAWVEVYLSGLGWIEIDPLAWNANAPLNEVEVVELPPIEAPAPVRPRVDVPSEAPQVPAYAETLLTNENRTPNWGLPIAIVIAAIGAYSLIRLTIRRAMRGKARAYNLDRVLARIHTMPKRLDYYHRDILRQLKLLDFDAQPGETLLTFSRRVDRRFRLEGVTFREVAGILMELHFAGREPEVDGLRRVSLYHEALEAHLLEKLGQTVYLFRRGSLWP
jgi:transglutaminase-like putative cysteine protease